MIRSSPLGASRYKMFSLAEQARIRESGRNAPNHSWASDRAIDLLVS